MSLFFSVRQAIHAPRERITDYGANFSNLPLLLRMQYKLQKKYQPYVTQNLLNFLSISVNTCKRDPLNFGPIRMCRIITILSVKIVWYS